MLLTFAPKSSSVCDSKVWSTSKKASVASNIFLGVYKIDALKVRYRNGVALTSWLKDTYNDFWNWAWSTRCWGVRWALQLFEKIFNPNIESISLLFACGLVCLSVWERQINTELSSSTVPVPVFLTARRAVVLIHIHISKKALFVINMCSFHVP